MHHTTPNHLEPLEARIAPAAVTVMYTDSDGDKVTVFASAGPLDLADLTLSDGTTGDLLSLNLTAAGFQGADISFQVIKGPQGDGLAHVGLINATGRDLGMVKVKGDLSKIAVGDSNTSSAALELLSVRSMGVEKLSADTTSSIIGGVGTIKVTKDFREARLFINGGNISLPDPAARVDLLKIGGSMVGGAATDSGSIEAEGGFGAIKIGKDIRGGAGNFSGRIESGTDIGSLKIGRDLLGGGGMFSGSISADVSLGKTRIGRDLVGSTAQGTGALRIEGSIGNVTIGRDLIGGNANDSGLVWAKDGNLGIVKVGHDVVGGEITGAANVTRSGSIIAHDSIAGVTLGGSLRGATDNGAGNFTLSAAIAVGKQLGPVVVKGSIVAQASAPALISAVALEDEPASGNDFAIARLTVVGSVVNANILAGYNLNGAPDNADASIGPVKVGGSWKSSNLVAGVRDTGATGFGIGDSVQLEDNNPNLTARIAGITIGGVVKGTGWMPTGFASQQIDFLSIGGVKVKLTAGASNDGSKLLAGTTDAYVEEVA